jgi:DNA-binding beta-propeller fold protein YncE
VSSVRSFTLALAGVVLAIAAPASAAERAGYTLTASIPGSDGFWDIASWDPARHLVLVAHGADVLVVDPAVGSVRAIATIARGHSALAVPGTGKALVTSGGDNSVRILDLASGEELARIAVGANPDASVVTADGSRAFTMNAGDGTVSLIDLKTDAETGRIALKPGLEFAALISPTELAVNNEDESEIELANLAIGKADGTIALTGCTGPTGLAYAPERHLAISACANGKAALVDMKSRKLVRLVDIGTGPDTALWDPKRQRFIIPCGRSGTLSVIDLGKRGNEPGVSQSPSEMGARTGAIDPATGRIFRPTARFGPGEPGKRPPLVPGTFHVLVMAPGA